MIPASLLLAFELLYGGIDESLTSLPNLICRSFQSERKKNKNSLSLSCKLLFDPFLTLNLLVFMGTEFCKGCINSLMSKTESQNNINDFIVGV